MVVGAGGMGTAVARRLGQRHRVLLADRNEETLRAKVSDLRKEGHDAIPCICDVTNSEAVADLARAAVAAGPPVVLAHVVGLSPSMGTFEQILTVDFVGAVLVERAFLPLATPGSAAVFVSSIAGHADIDNSLLHLAERAAPSEVVGILSRELGTEATSTLAYIVAKAALIRMCRRQAADWGARGARIMSISPGLIATEMGALEFQHQPQKHELLATTPLQREGTLLEIADVVEYLTSDRASFINGVDLVVDGGLTAVQRSASERAPS